MSATRCKVCSNPTIRGQVARMVEEGLSDDAISRALNSVGVVIGKSSILRHRQNHSDADIDTDEVTIPDDMDVPRPVHVEQSPAMGDDPAQLIEEIRAQVLNQNVDILQDRMVRETLLQKILESQLAITATALDRFQKGDGRYPVDMVKATASTWALFEKTSLHSMVVNESKTFLFDNEVERLERIVFNDARERVLDGEEVESEAPDEYLMDRRRNFIGEMETTSFTFCQHRMDGDTFNIRMTLAWKRGIASGKAELAKVAA